MSENDKDNKDFEFIKEQVIEKKRKKIKKLLYPAITNVGFAIIFGAVAALTFVIVEPRLNKMIQKDEEPIPPVCFPTACPTEYPTSSPSTSHVVTPEPTPVIVEQSIAANVDDYLSINTDIKRVAFDVSKAIVNISSTFAVEDWFGKSRDKEVTTTGVIVYNNTKDLLILVSLDRVKGADNIKIEFPNNQTVDAVLQDYESELNLAMIAVPIKDIPKYYADTLKPAILGESYTISVGNPIIALGSPNGYANSMDLGIITSKGSAQSITDNSMDLFNTSINDTSESDGIISNMKGEVIGLITRSLKEGNNKDINTVIGISCLKPIIEVMGNKEPHVYFGIKADDLTDEAKKEYEITNGIYINDVQSDSPAFDAGIQKGDIIVDIGKLMVSSVNNFNNIITSHKPGDKLYVKILRLTGSKTKEINLYVTLGDKAN